MVKNKKAAICHSVTKAMQMTKTPITIPAGNTLTEFSSVINRAAIIEPKATPMATVAVNCVA